LTNSRIGSRTRQRSGIIAELHLKSGDFSSILRPMAITSLTRQQVRSIDRRAIDEFGMSGLVLMENAGRGCTEVLLQQGVKGRVVIACGKGNNAGDGFVIARHLDRRQIPVQIVLFTDPADLAGEALANYNIASLAGIPIRIYQHGKDAIGLLAGAEWVIDALLGTGASGPPRPPLDEAIGLLNTASGKKLAIDLPSGLDCDSGIPANVTFRADHTCTFVAPKVGFANPAAAEYLGKVHNVDIGVPRRLLEEVAS
jgi:NAD(P)H-hydrate epimerase